MTTQHCAYSGFLLQLCLAALVCWEPFREAASNLVREQAWILLSDQMAAIDPDASRMRHLLGNFGFVVERLNGRFWSREHEMSGQRRWNHVKPRERSIGS